MSENVQRKLGRIKTHSTFMFISKSIVMQVNFVKNNRYSCGHEPNNSSKQFLEVFKSALYHGAFFSLEPMKSLQFCDYKEDLMFCQYCTGGFIPWTHSQCTVNMASVADWQLMLSFLWSTMKESRMVQSISYNYRRMWVQKNTLIVQLWWRPKWSTLSGTIKDKNTMKQPCSSTFSQTILEE